MHEVHLLMIVLLFANAVRATADDELEALIAEIERQEVHYAELEFVASSTFMVCDDHPANADLSTTDILAEECRADYSVRDGCWRFYAERTSHYFLRDSRRSCEGVWNRTEERLLVDVVETEEASGEEISSTLTGSAYEIPRPWPTNLGGGRFICPHMIWTDTWAGPPLSVLLQGRDAIRAALGTRNTFTVRVQDLGEEERDGLRCRLLRVDLIRDDGTQGPAVELWLAHERNLIPVRSAFFVTGDSATPDRLTTVLEWHEPSPGVHFPKLLLDEGFDPSITSADERQLPVSRREWAVESVATTCQRPDSDFETLEFSEGVEVFR